VDIPSILEKNSCILTLFPCIWIRGCPCAWRYSTPSRSYRPLGPGEVTDAQDDALSLELRFPFQGDHDVIIIYRTLDERIEISFWANTFFFKQT
jgi:hypothetical protein